ncbi:MAG: BamA/TamA family outer membrane protein [Flavobacteriales bacterium]|nr:BamA/TamA family outer membrane protein [Flavobacteriales bacterium]
MRWRRRFFLPFATLLLPIHLAAQAYEGPFRIGGVVVTGNKVTRDRVILRELTVQEGDTLNTQELQAALARSRENLLNTGLFNTVTVLPVFLGPQEAFVQVEVNERWYLWPSPIFELADPNFNVWWETKDFDRVNWGLYLYRYNFRGMNETVYLKAQLGYAQQYGVKYKVPFLSRDGRWGLSVGGGYYQQNEITVATEDNERIFYRPPEGNARTEWNAETELTFRRTHDVRHAFRLAYRSATVVPEVALGWPDHFNDGAPSISYLSIGYTFLRDRRDARIFTTAGSYAELKVDRFGLGLLDEHAPENTVIYGTVKKWWHPAERWIASWSPRAHHAGATATLLHPGRIGLHALCARLRVLRDRWPAFRPRPCERVLRVGEAAHPARGLHADGGFPDPASRALSERLRGYGICVG